MTLPEEMRERQRTRGRPRPTAIVAVAERGYHSPAIPRCTPAFGVGEDALPARMSGPVSRKAASGCGMNYGLDVSTARLLSGGMGWPALRDERKNGI